MTLAVPAPPLRRKTAPLERASDPSRRADVGSATAPLASEDIPEETCTELRLPARGAAILQVAAALIWIPQAAVIALAIGVIAGGEPASRAIWLATCLFAMGVLRAVLDGVATRLAFRQSRPIVSERRAEAVARLASRSPIDATRPSAGEAASVIAEQADAVLTHLVRFEAARTKATVVPIAILASVFPVSWVSAAILALSAPLIPTFMALIGWRAKAASEAQLAEVGGMNGLLLDRLRGLATIRSMDAVDMTARRLRGRAENVRVNTMAVLRIAFLSSAVLELFASLGVALVAVHVGFHLLGQIQFGMWGRGLDLTQGLFVLLLAPAFFEPLRDLAAAWHDKAAGEAAAKSLDGLARGGVPLPESRDADQANPLEWRSEPRIELLGIGYGHSVSRSPAISDLWLSIAPGERVALLGPSGSGKSTILALIAGLAPTELGRILVGGVPLDGPETASIRRRIAWIGQRPHMFNAGISYNVGLGRPWVGQSDVERALARADLSDFSDRRGSAPIGEDGFGMSGGEAVRLALARACADPLKDIVLADEPTAHLDAGTAASIVAGLLESTRGKTLVVATHDPVLASRMDRVVRLGVGCEIAQ